MKKKDYVWLQELLSSEGIILLVAPLAEAEAEWKENESKIPAGQAENLQFTQL